MKRIMLLIALLAISAQAVCAQVSEVEKKKLEEQVVLAIKKHEGLGLSTEELVEKVAADLLVQAQALQDDVAVEEKCNFNKKLIIGLVVALAACGLGYYVYKTYLFSKTEIEKVAEDVLCALGKKRSLSSEERAKMSKFPEEHPKPAEELIAQWSKAVKLGDEDKVFKRLLEIQEAFKAKYPDVYLHQYGLEV